MKKLAIILGLAALICLGACAGKKEAKAMKTDKESRVAVVYFSATGTTRGEAELIARAENAPLIEIQPEQPYSAADLNWNDKKSRSTVEMNDSSARPAIRPVTADFAKTDTIFLGYPIWWDLAPRVVNTFIESQNLKGKTVIPFATSGGSSITNSVKELRRQYPDIKWGEGRLLNGAGEGAVDNWVDSLSR